MAGAFLWFFFVVDDRPPAAFSRLIRIERSMVERLP
jgi:hypothetical protein